MVRLEPLGEDDFAMWWQEAIPAYAQDKIDAGNWTAEGAREKAENEFRRFLPQGMATPGNSLLSIIDEATGEHVGVLWYSVGDWGGRASVFVLDFVVFAPYRRHGFGLQALAALEARVRSMGLDRIELHVFGHNRAAQALYLKAGYEITNINMAKRLAPGAS